MQTVQEAIRAEAVVRPPRAGFESDVQQFLSRLVQRLDYPKDSRHRYIIVAHLFNDTMRMLEALEPVVEFDAIIGVPYSSNRPGVAERWTRRFGDKVHVKANIEQMERTLVEQLARSLAACRKNGQRLIVQEVGGFVTPLLHRYFAEQLDLVKGVVEITKQGVWRAEALDLSIPVLHCADSELKRLEARRCGETIARCLDGVARDLGLSLAGRHATVFGAGWIGSGVAEALKRLDVIPALVDSNPLKVAEARLAGFTASCRADWLGVSQLVVGATGRTSITREMIDRLPHNAIVASGSSRQLEIEIDYLKDHPSTPVSDCVEAFHLDCSAGGDGFRNVLLVNDGYPANFIPGSGSVPDEIVETILGELIVLMHALSQDGFDPGIHRITREQESLCAELWLEMRDEAMPELAFIPKPRLVSDAATLSRRISE